MDELLFRFINQSLSNEFFDWLLPWWRHRWTWLPLYAVFVGVFVYAYGVRFWQVALVMALGLGAADLTSSKLIKPGIGRERPCRQWSAERGELRLLVPCGGGYSFPSSHAANHFALSTLLWLFWGRRWRRRRFVLGLTLYAWAASIGFGQIYVGLHFPGDVLAGALLGTGLGLAAFWSLGRRIAPPN